MRRTLWTLALGTSLSVLALPSDVLAGRGGRFGGMRGGGFGGMQRGEFGGGGMRGGERGEAGGGEMMRDERGGYGGGMSHSPSFSQPRSRSNGASNEGRNPYENRSGSGGRNPYEDRSGSGGRNPNSNNPYAERSEANRNDSSLPNSGAGAKGAAAGAGYANRNDSSLPNSGAGAKGAAAGAGYANRNRRYSTAGAAALGSSVGYWHGHDSGAWGVGGYGMDRYGMGRYGYGGYGLGYGGVGAWGFGSPMYAWGYSSYANPYYGGDIGGGNQGGGDASQQGYNYAQPISTTAAEPEPAVADQVTAGVSQARDVFQAGDYDQALKLDQQALTQSPNDPTLHQLLALIDFAQGKYEKAAGPLYAVLSVGPGWNWTTLSGMYPDVETYTGQLRKLESYVGAHPRSAAARFVLGYHYLCEGHDANAVAQFKVAVSLQPADTLSAQLIAQYQPAGSGQPTPPPATPDATPGVAGKLAGKWSAMTASGAHVDLTIADDDGFVWSVSGPGKPATTIAGTSSLADGLLTLAGKGAQDGALAGNVAWLGPDRFTFRLVGAPAQDPGLKFAR